ncbi:hypothetical protein CRENBAI_003328 [Crenichthys baileyi]|uniref:Uncharacterized protein n=1 Tax=Crenichthys baileyi TaxID=28760 RepID=A0AAV9SNS3_9TELE
MFKADAPANYPNDPQSPSWGEKQSLRVWVSLPVKMMSKTQHHRRYTVEENASGRDEDIPQKIYTKIAEDIVTKAATDKEDEETPQKVILRAEEADVTKYSSRRAVDMRDVSAETDETKVNAVREMLFFVLCMDMQNSIISIHLADLKDNNLAEHL